MIAGNVFGYDRSADEDEKDAADATAVEEIELEESLEVTLEEQAERFEEKEDEQWHGDSDKEEHEDEQRLDPASDEDKRNVETSEDIGATTAASPASAVDEDGSEEKNIADDIESVESTIETEEEEEEDEKDIEEGYDSDDSSVDDEDDDYENDNAGSDWNDNDHEDDKELETYPIVMAPVVAVGDVAAVIDEEFEEITSVEEDKEDCLELGLSDGVAGLQDAAKDRDCASSISFSGVDEQEDAGLEAAAGSVTIDVVIVNNKDDDDDDDNDNDDHGEHVWLDDIHDDIHNDIHDDTHDDDISNDVDEGPDYRGDNKYSQTQERDKQRLALALEPLLSLQRLLLEQFACSDALPDSRLVEVAFGQAVDLARVATLHCSSPPPEAPTTAAAASAATAPSSILAAWGRWLWDRGGEPERAVKLLLQAGRPREAADLLGRLDSSFGPCAALRRCPVPNHERKPRRFCLAR